MKVREIITENTGVSLTVLCVLVSLIASLIAYGTTIDNTVKEHEKDIVKLKADAIADHDTLIRIDANVKELLKRR